MEWSRYKVVPFDQLFKILIPIKQPKKICTSGANLASNDTRQIWHERFSDQNKRHIQKILKQHRIIVVSDDKFCGVCVKGRATSK